MLNWGALTELFEDAMAVARAIVSTIHEYDIWKQMILHTVGL